MITLENNLTVTISAIAAAISAATALISVLYSLKKSRRQLLDELKVVVLEYVSSVQGQQKWRETMDLHETEETKVSVIHLLTLLDKKYHKKKWYRILPAALTELKNEGFHTELSIGASRKIINQPTTIQIE